MDSNNKIKTSEQNLKTALNAQLSDKAKKAIKEKIESLGKEIKK